MARKKTKSDEVLLDAAREMFLRDGIGASTKKIAQSAGVSEGILFQRFGSKQALFFKAMRVPTPDLSQAIEDCDGIDDPVEALVVLATGALEYFRSIMPIVLLVLAHPASKELFRTHGHSEEMLFESFGINQSIRDFFDRQVEKQSLSKRDYGTVSDILLSTLLTRALHEQIGLDSNDLASQWLQTIIKVLLD